jgi:hypothetical protein
MSARHPFDVADSNKEASNRHRTEFERDAKKLTARDRSVDQHHGGMLLVLFVIMSLIKTKILGYKLVRRREQRITLQYNWR